MLAAASRACLGARVGSFAKGAHSRRALRFLPLRARCGRTASSTPAAMAAKFGKNGERVYPEEGKVEVDGKFYRRCAAALVFNLNGDVLLGERLDRPGSWGMPQGGVEVRRARPDRGFLRVVSARLSSRHHFTRAGAFDRGNTVNHH